jgi:hypothetical protein
MPTANRPARSTERGVHAGRKHTLKPSQRAEATRIRQDGKSLGKSPPCLAAAGSVVHRAMQGAAPAG